MNFQLPKQDEDFDYYGNSSQDESKGSQGRQFGYARNFTFFLLGLFLFFWFFIFIFRVESQLGIQFISTFFFVYSHCMYVVSVSQVDAFRNYLMLSL